MAGEPIGRAAKLPHRVLAGADQRARPSLAAGQHAAGERGQQPGPDHGGLAAAGGADDREQRRADEPRDQVGDELLAPEEVLGVVRVEGREALVWADHGCLGVRAGACEQPGALAGRLQVHDVAGQLGLQRAGLAAAGRRAARHRVDAARCLAPCPLAGRLVHAPRDAAARGDQRLDRHRVVVAGRSVEAGDQRDGLRVERLEGDRFPRLEPRERGRLLAGGQHQRR